MHRGLLFITEGRWVGMWVMKLRHKCMELGFCFQFLLKNSVSLCETWMTAQKCWLLQGEVGQLGETLITSKCQLWEAPITTSFCTLFPNVLCPSVHFLLLILFSHTNLVVAGLKGSNQLWRGGGTGSPRKRWSHWSGQKWADVVALCNVV